MNNSTAITPDNLPRIRFTGLPVITTVALASVYRAKPKNIQDNFQNNADRFEAGKHFFKLEGADLKAFKNSPDNIGSVEKQARSLILWTERGAARHAKMLDTDEAWEVFEKLEDSYFLIKGQGGSSFPVPVQTLMGTVIGSDGEHVLDQVIDQKASALPTALRRSFKHTMKSRLRTRFSVQKTALIPAEELPNACNFIAAYNVLEGEFIAKEAPQLQLPLNIHYPIEALAALREDMLTVRNDKQAWLDVTLDDIRDTRDGTTPLESLLWDLEKAGFDIRGAWWELRTYRNKLREITSFVKGLGRVMEEPQRYAVDAPKGRAAA